MILESPAKINLTLEILGKRKDNFHEIRSIVVKIDLCDEIILEKGSGKVEFLNVSSLNEKNNIRDFFEKFKIKDFDVKIFKRIPIGAGLGGGTSNLAVILNYLKKINYFSQGTYEEILKDLPSDTYLFLENSSFLFVEGRGEKVKKINIRDKKFNLYFNLYFPGIFSSTKLIYENLNNYSDGKISLNLLEVLESSKISFEEIKKYIGRNDLFEPFYKIYKIKKEKFYLSGSGSTFYNIEDSSEFLNYLKARIYHVR